LEEKQPIPENKMTRKIGEDEQKKHKTTTLPKEVRKLGMPNGKSEQQFD